MPLFHSVLLAAADQYHDASDLQGPEHFYGEYLGQMRNLGSTGQVGNLILRYHIDWGTSTTARTIPRVGRPNLPEKLDAWFAEIEPLIKRCSKHVLWNCDLRRIGPELLFAFESLRTIRQVETGKRRLSFGPTLTGKTLHLLLPDLCMIWDEAVVRSPLDLDNQAWDYLSYLRIQKAVLNQAISSLNKESALPPEGAIRWIVEEHRTRRDRRAPLGYDEPITKILDEAMDERNYTRGWVRPLVAKMETVPWV